MQSQLEAYKQRVLGKKRRRHDGDASGANKASKADPSTAFLLKKAPVCAESVRFFRRWKDRVHFELEQPSKWRNWRHAVKLSVRRGVIGMFAPRSHEIVRMVASELHDEPINAMTIQIEEKILPHVSTYDGENSGGLSYIALNSSRAFPKQGVEVVLVFNTKAPTKKLCSILKKIAMDLPGLHSLWLHCNPADRHDNRIFSHNENAWQKIFGSKISLRERLNVENLPYRMPILRLPPQVFRQANPECFAQIIVALRSALKGREYRKIVELYAGVGTVGLHMLDFLSEEGKIFCSDSNPFNEVPFLEASSKLPNSLRIAPYETKSAAEVSNEGQLADAELLIVDPPRKGLDDEVFAAISEAGSLKDIAFISCGFHAFQSNCTSLENFGFNLEFAKAFLMFPGANHLETLAVFHKKEEKKKKL